VTLPHLAQNHPHDFTKTKKKGHTVILVEQNFHVASQLADRHYVMEHGRIVDVIARHELAGGFDRIKSLLGI
jgi:branched-chain amino acid transport system ATP-binding protein